MPPISSRREGGQADCLGLFQAAQGTVRRLLLKRTTTACLPLFALTRRVSKASPAARNSTRSGDKQGDRPSSTDSRLAFMWLRNGLARANRMIRLYAGSSNSFLVP